MARIRPLGEVFEPISKPKQVVPSAPIAGDETMPPVAAVDKVE